MVVNQLTLKNYNKSYEKNILYHFEFFISRNTYD